MELMRRIHDLMEKDANNNLQRHGVTFTQLHMLMALGREEDRRGGPVQLKDLERYFRVAQSTAAGVVVRLEKKGLVSSFTDQADKRIKWLRITEPGREVCRCTRADMEDGRRRFLSGLDPEEQAEFARLLQKVYDALIMVP